MFNMPKNLYTFMWCYGSNNQYRIMDEISICDLKKGSLFCAKDIDGEFITDNDGNNIFEAQDSEVYEDPFGPFVYCEPVGRIDE